MSISISVGPWGGKGGDPWDDKVNGGIRKIELKYDRVIDSINIEYEKDGSYVWRMHGGNGGNQIGKIELEYPKERIISITGHYDNYIRSLTFESNTKKYGPYGVQEGTYFTFTMAGGKIVGFYGRSGWYLDGIGVHISNLQPQSPLSPLKIPIPSPRTMHVGNFPSSMLGEIPSAGEATVNAEGNEEDVRTTQDIA